MRSTADLRGGREIADMPGTFTDDFVVPNTREFPPPRELLQVFDRAGIEKDHLRTLAMNDCHVMVSREPAGKNGERLWHLSISRPDRHPTWDEIKFARYRLLPADLCFAILLPPPELYVNVPSQDHVFHLWEIYDVREPWSGQ